MNRLKTCRTVMLCLGIIALLLRISQTVFFVDNTLCLENTKSFSYYAFYLTVILIVVFAVVMLFVLKNDDFINQSERAYSLDKNIVPTFAAVSTVASTVYTVITGYGYFNGNIYINVANIVLSAFLVAFYCFCIFASERVNVNNWRGIFCLMPIACYLFRLIMIFVYYTTNVRDYNFKMIILTNAALLIFFLNYARHLDNGKFSKRLFVSGLFAVAISVATWIPTIVTIRSLPAFGGDAISNLLNGLFDISSALFAFSSIRMFCVSKSENNAISEKILKKSRKKAK